MEYGVQNITGNEIVVVKLAGLNSVFSREKEERANGTF